MALEPRRPDVEEDWQRDRQREDDEQRRLEATDRERVWRESWEPWPR